MATLIQCLEKGAGLWRISGNTGVSHSNLVLDYAVGLIARCADASSQTQCRN